MTTEIASEKVLRQMLDRQEIRDVLATFARGIDRSDVEMVRTVFWPDGTFDHGRLAAGPVEGFLKQMPTWPFVWTQHHLAQTMYEFEGSDVALVIADRQVADEEQAHSRDAAYNGDEITHVKFFADDKWREYWEKPPEPDVLRERFQPVAKAFVLDGDGNPWLAFGSFWTGIKMRRLDPETGKLHWSVPLQ